MPLLFFVYGMPLLFGVSSGWLTQEILELSWSACVVVPVRHTSGRRGWSSCSDSLRGDASLNRKKIWRFLPLH